MSYFRFNIYKSINVNIALKKVKNDMIISIDAITTLLLCYVSENFSKVYQTKSLHTLAIKSQQECLFMDL